MASASNEPKKRQQGFAVATSNASIHPMTTSVNAASSAFASPPPSSSYIDTSYLLDDEMWRTMTVDADIPKGRSQEPTAQGSYYSESSGTDAIMEDITANEPASAGTDTQSQAAQYPWEDGLHHLDDWLGLPPWSNTGGAGAISAITPDKIGIAAKSPSTVQTPESGKAVGRRIVAQRLDGSPFTEGSFSTGESMSSSEQMTSIPGTGTLSSSALSSSSPNSRLSSLPSQPSAAAVQMPTTAKPKRQRSTTSSMAAPPESVSAILENNRTGRTPSTSASSSRRAVSANGRGDGIRGRDGKRSLSVERHALKKEAAAGGVGKAAKPKTTRMRRTSIGPAAQVISNVGKSSSTGSPGAAPLQIDTSTSTATISSGPQTFSGVPTMPWNASPWPAGMYPHAAPWGHFAPGGVPYGTFPPGWPMWSPGPPPPQSMAMHPAWSLPLNGNYMTTPAPSGTNAPQGWTAEGNADASLSPGIIQPLSLPMTSSMQSIFSSMRGLHVGSVAPGQEQEGEQQVYSTSDTVPPPFQPTGCSEAWGQSMTKTVSEGGRQVSPSQSLLHSKGNQAGSSNSSWNLENIVPKGRVGNGRTASPHSASEGSPCDDRSNDGDCVRKSIKSSNSASASPPSVVVGSSRTNVPMATPSERPTHHRRASRSLNRATSIRGSKLEDVPEGETVNSHSPPDAYNKDGASDSTATLLQSVDSSGTVSAANNDKLRRLSDASVRENLKNKPLDGKKKKGTLSGVSGQEDGEDEDDHLDGDDDEEEDAEDEDDMQEDAPATSSRKPVRGRTTGISGRPVRSEQERRKRRRESHNLVERRRRDTINERIAELASLLPEAMLLDAIAHSQGGGNNSKVVQVAVPEEMLSRLNSAGRNEMGGGSTLDILSLASAPANSETLALAQARPNKGIILRKSVDYIRALQEFIEQQGKHARMLREEVERVTGLLEETKVNVNFQLEQQQQQQQPPSLLPQHHHQQPQHQHQHPQQPQESGSKKLWPDEYGQQTTPFHRFDEHDTRHSSLPGLGLFTESASHHHHHQQQQQNGHGGVEDSPTSGGYPQLGPGQSPPPTLAEWLAAAQDHQQQSMKGKAVMGDGNRGDQVEESERTMAFLK